MISVFVAVAFPRRVVSGALPERLPAVVQSTFVREVSLQITLLDPSESKMPDFTSERHHKKQLTIFLFDLVRYFTGF